MWSQCSKGDWCLISALFACILHMSLSSEAASCTVRVWLLIVVTLLLALPPKVTSSYVFAVMYSTRI